MKLQIKPIIMFLTLLVLLVLFVSGCAFFKQPQGEIFTEIIAQDVGYIIAKENPDLATSLLKYMETMPDFENWKTWVIVRLVEDEFLRMNFEKLVSLIEVDLKGINNIEKQMDIIMPILQNFAQGIKIGLK